MYANDKNQEKERYKKKKKEKTIKVRKIRQLIWLQSDIKLANIKTIQLALDKNEC